MTASAPKSPLESYKIKAKLLQKAKAKANKPILLKEAYHIIAKSSGFTTWKEMKDLLEASGDLCPPGNSAFWKTWYPTYEEALSHLRVQGDFLVPFQRHFFICDIHYVEALGISKDDLDLQQVGNDWAQPKNEKAWKSLLQKIKKHHSRKK